jgi:ATP-dependent protease HslVU (ClpYQ) peptidase subunit
MTTIAYKDGVIAYDSRITRGDTIMDDDAEKMVMRDGYTFFCTGPTPDIEKLIELYCMRHASGDISANAFVVHDGFVWMAGWNETDGLWRSKIGADKVNAIGSGSDHALTAMDCGKSAYESVEMAKKRDTNTGGQVRIFKVA